MLYAKVLLSTVPHARIKSIDTSAAEALARSKGGSHLQERPRCATTARSVLLSTKLPDTERILTTPCALWETGWPAVAAESRT